MIKFIALILLVLQNVAVVLTMHYSQVGGTYLTTTAVVTQEIIKLMLSAIILWFTHDGSRAKATPYLELITSRLSNSTDMARIGVPGTLYLLQNNLLFVATRNLASSEYQVLCQMKILVTGFLSYLILSKFLSLTQWIALVFLMMGCGMAEIPGAEVATSKTGENKMFGLMALVAAVFISGFAGVYTEKLLKETADSMWMRNIQLALFGIFFGLVVCIAEDGAKIRQGGFFQGYDSHIVWGVILLNAGGGLLVAVVLKYGDNMVKCFATAMGLILTYLVQKLIEPSSRDSPYFVPGAMLVCLSVILYTLFPYRAGEAVAVPAMKYKWDAIEDVESGMDTKKWNPPVEDADDCTPLNRDIRPSQLGKRQTAS